MIGALDSFFNLDRQLFRGVPCQQYSQRVLRPLPHASVAHIGKLGARQMVKRSDVEDYSVEVRRAFEKGDRRALLRMLWFCVLYRWPAPDWAANVFDAFYRAALDGDIESWDDVFGRPNTREATGDTSQTANRRFAIWGKAKEISEDEGVPINDLLFGRISRELRIDDAKQAAEMYEEVERAVRAPNINRP